jgi:hypothetical protein
MKIFLMQIVICPILSWMVLYSFRWYFQHQTLWNLYLIHVQCRLWKHIVESASGFLTCSKLILFIRRNTTILPVTSIICWFSELSSSTFCFHEWIFSLNFARKCQMHLCLYRPISPCGPRFFQGVPHLHWHLSTAVMTKHRMKVAGAEHKVDTICRNKTALSLLCRISQLTFISELPEILR